ncbi:hypothetical protein [Craterilacuibacter sinensis]|uniref:Uncharacterized protein n=1 Tax=Craterilacuibacter sinensis TaxID=2686017 RepID=A0A845BRM3_9NEIS|nr:hypothetical protein [Craterilacuibacter sinensis]MXR37808.1 hypothetical protein [Craterilacuibacter sinensis]
MTVIAPHGQALPDNLPVLTEVVETELPVSGSFSEAEPFASQHFGAPLDLPPALTQALPPVLDVTPGDALFESLPAIDLELGAGSAHQTAKDEALFSELAPADIWLDHTTPPASVDSLLEDFDFAFDAPDPALALSATAPSSSWQSDVPDLDLASLVPDTPLEDMQPLPDATGLPAVDARFDFSPASQPPAFEAETGHGLPLQPEIEVAGVPVFEEVPEPVVMPALMEEPEPVVMPALMEEPEPVVMPALMEEPEPVVMPALMEEPEPVVMPALMEEPEPVVMPALMEEPEPVVMPALMEVPEPVVMPALAVGAACAVMPLLDQTQAVASSIEPPARKQNIAVVDEAALLDAVYQRIVPRMKVELTLWLQDAIEVQSKHMLAGVMQQMKEDYDMLFGETLRESVRQAIADIGQNEQCKDDNHG